MDGLSDAKEKRGDEGRPERHGEIEKGQLSPCHVTELELNLATEAGV